MESIQHDSDLTGRESIFDGVMYVFVGGEHYTIPEASERFQMCSAKEMFKRLREGWIDEEAVLVPTDEIVEKIRKDFYGLHLMIDLLDADSEKLGSIDTVSKFLDEGPSEIDMVKISQPYVFRYNDPIPENWGITGTVILSTSHMSTHTYPEKGYISLDVFSCKSFNPYKVLQKARAVFGGSRAHINIVLRGKGFERTE